MRRPDRRLARTLGILRERPQPGRPKRADDHPIRAYWRLLLGLNNAGNDERQREEVIRKYPDVYQAHALWYSPDFATRQGLEAWLLTSESYEQIAQRFFTVPRAIDYYEQLFFNVRDRVKNSDWITKVIRDRMHDDLKYGCSKADAERGYVMRLFAHRGGPFVLDAYINVLGMSHSPLSAKEVARWCKDGLQNAVLTTAAAAAVSFDLTQKNMMQVMKLAVRSGISIRSPEEIAKENEYCNRIIDVWDTIEKAMNGGAAPGPVDKAR
jgi:hypothetical protein